MHFVSFAEHALFLDEVRTALGRTPYMRCAALYVEMLKFETLGVAEARDPLIGEFYPKGREHSRIFLEVISHLLFEERDRLSILEVLPRPNLASIKNPCHRACVPCSLYLQIGDPYRRDANSILFNQIVKTAPVIFEGRQHNTVWAVECGAPQFPGEKTAVDRVLWHEP